MVVKRNRGTSIRTSKERNRTAVVVGAGVTLIATIAFVLLSAFFPLQQLKLVVLETTSRWIYGDPFLQLRLLGPAVGGVVAGYLAVDINGRHTWMTSMKYGCLAAIAGVGLVYLVYAGYIAVRYAEAILWDPAINLQIAHFLDVVFSPLFFTLSLLAIGLFEGLFAGALGNGIWHLISGLTSNR